MKEYLMKPNKQCCNCVHLSACLSKSIAGKLYIWVIL